MSFSGTVKRANVPNIEGGWSSVYVADFGGFKLVLSIWPREYACKIDAEFKGSCIIVQEYVDFVNDNLFDEYGMRCRVFMQDARLEEIEDHYLRLELESFPMILEDSGDARKVPVVICSVWDRETQAFWDITQWNDRLWGFPDSTKNGSPKGDIAFLCNTMST